MNSETQTRTATATTTRETMNPSANVLVRHFSGSAALLGKFKRQPKHYGGLSQKRQPRGWLKGSGTPTVGFHTRKGTQRKKCLFSFSVLIFYFF